MGKFEEIHKNNELYLDIAANASGDEKGALVLRAIERLGLNSVEIMEVGPGGGSAINFLADSLGHDRFTQTQVNLTLLEADPINSTALSAAMERFDTIGSSQRVNGYA